MKSCLIDFVITVLVIFDLSINFLINRFENNTFLQSEFKIQTALGTLFNDYSEKCFTLLNLIIY